MVLLEENFLNSIILFRLKSMEYNLFGLQEQMLFPNDNNLKLWSLHYCCGWSEVASTNSSELCGCTGLQSLNLPIPKDGYNKEVTDLERWLDYIHSP